MTLLGADIPDATLMALGVRWEMAETLSASAAREQAPWVGTRIYRAGVSCGQLSDDQEGR